MAARGRESSSPPSWRRNARASRSGFAAYQDAEAAPRAVAPGARGVQPRRERAAVPRSRFGAQFDALKGAAQHDLASASRASRRCFRSDAKRARQGEQTLGGRRVEPAARPRSASRPAHQPGDGQKGLERDARLVQALRAPQVRGRWVRSAQARGRARRHGRALRFRGAADVRGRLVLLRPTSSSRCPAAGASSVDAKAPLLAYLEAVEFGRPGRPRRAPPRSCGAGRPTSRSSPGRGIGSRCPSRPTSSCCSCPGGLLQRGAAARSIAARVRRRAQGVPSPADYAAALLRTPPTVDAGEKARRRMRRTSATSGGTSNERLCRCSITSKTCALRLDAVAVQAHNAAVGSMESRVLRAARRSGNRLVSGKELAEVAPSTTCPGACRRRSSHPVSRRGCRSRSGAAGPAGVDGSRAVTLALPVRHAARAPTARRRRRRPRREIPRSVASEGDTHGGISISRCGAPRARSGRRSARCQDARGGAARARPSNIRCRRSPGIRGDAHVPATLFQELQPD